MPNTRHRQWRRALARASIAVLAGTLTCIGPVVAIALERAPARDALTALALSGLAASDRDAVAYAVGDRIKVTFFEQLRTAETRGPLSDLIERTELSGEYQVQQDGHVFLPILGAVRVAGLSHAQVQEALVAAFARQMEGQVRVAVQLIDREPVYVTGAVARPGPFKHLPGMTVLHAITLAGGVEGANTDLWRLLDLGRERERMRKSAERLKELLARADVLRAERYGKAPEPSGRLVQLVGRAGAEELVAGEERLRALHRRRLKELNAAIDALMAATRNELKILQDRTAQVEIRIKEKADWARALAGSRHVTDNTLHLAQSELSDARERWHEARASIAQIERKLAELQQERMRAAIDAEIAREHDLQQTLKAVAEEEVTTAVIGNLLVAAPEAYARKRAERQFSYTIIRRSPSGLERLSGTDVFALVPGDLVEVVPLNSDALASGPEQVKSR